MSCSIKFSKTTCTIHHDTRGIEWSVSSVVSIICYFFKVVLVPRLNVGIKYGHKLISVRPRVLMHCTWTTNDTVRFKLDWSNQGSGESHVGSFRQRARQQIQGWRSDPCLLHCPQPFQHRRSKRGLDSNHHPSLNRSGAVPWSLHPPIWKCWVYAWLTGKLTLTWTWCRAPLSWYGRGLG